MAETFQLDISGMDIGEVEDMAEYVGMATGAFMKLLADLEELPAAERVYAMPNGMLTALIWISGRRKNPDFTIEEAARVKVTELAYTPATGKGSSGRPKNPPARQPLAQRPARTRARTAQAS